MDVAKIEERIDRTAAGATVVSMEIGGVKFQNMMEVMEFAKLMAVSGDAIPPHLRGNPGACLAILTKALRFGFEPYALAEHSFLTKKKNRDGVEEGTIAYDSFVIHAIIEAHGEITSSLSRSYEGEGDDKKCIVIGIIDGEEKRYDGPTLGSIKASIGRNQYGGLKGSPLWEKKPEQQLWYDARRDWCRAFQPHILLGWYDKDEFEGNRGPDRAKDITPKPSIGDRLKGSKGRGFSSSHVERETGGEKIDRATGEVMNSQATAGGADEVAKTHEGQMHQADASATENRSAGAQEGTRAGETPASESLANAGTGSESQEGPGQQASDSSASRLPDGRTSGAAQPEPGTNGGASNAGVQDGDSSERVTSGGGENHPLQPDLLSEPPSSSGGKGGPDAPVGSTEGADGGRGDAPSAPDRLRSYSKALLSIESGGPAKLVKQSEAWMKKFNGFDGADEEKRKSIYAAHLMRAIGSMNIEETKAKVEEIIGK